jgi:hypothetical protein
MLFRRLLDCHVVMYDNKVLEDFASSLKKEVTSSSETLISNHITKRRHNPEDHDLNYHHRIHFKHGIVILAWINYTVIIKCASSACISSLVVLLRLIKLHVL